MRKSLQFVLATVVAGAALSVGAQTFARADTPEIDVRQARQEARIERALGRGELTRFEARELRRGQRETSLASPPRAHDSVERVQRLALPARTASRYLTSRVSGNAEYQPNQNARCAGSRRKLSPFGPVRCDSLTSQTLPRLSRAAATLFQLANVVSRES